MTDGLALGWVTLVCLAGSTMLMSNDRVGSSIPRISALTSLTSSSKTLFCGVLRSFLTLASYSIFFCSKPIIVVTVSWFATFCNENNTMNQWETPIW